MLQVLTVTFMEVDQLCHSSLLQAVTIYYFKKLSVQEAENQENGSRGQIN